MGAPKKAYTPDARRDMHKELAAAAALKHQIAEAFGDEQDLVLLRDTVEGQTDLDGAIDKVLEQMALDVANIQGLEKFESTMAARRKRLGDRVETMRSMLLNALDILEEKRVERPIALLTLKSLLRIFIAERVDPHARNGRIPFGQNGRDCFEQDDLAHTFVAANDLESKFTDVARM